jgi:hypothetical protein
VSENRELRIFGSKRKGMAEDWRMHNEAFHNLYTPSNRIWDEQGM